jgi:hypothetical protein
MMLSLENLFVIRSNKLNVKSLGVALVWCKSKSSSMALSNEHSRQIQSGRGNSERIGETKTGSGRLPDLPPAAGKQTPTVRSGRPAA